MTANSKNKKVVKATASTTPDVLLQIAVEKGVDIDQLEKLMSLQERWNEQEAKKRFNEAVNQFQANKPDLIKGKKVDFKTQTGRVSYNYNPLPKIQKAVDPVLSNYGLSYKWEQSTEGGKIRITCIISHVEGHCEKTWLESDLDTSGKKNTIQSLGSTVTYLKRYTLENALGLSSDEDDDGETGGISQEEMIESIRKQVQNCSKQEELNLLYDSLEDVYKNNESLKKHFKARQTAFKTKNNGQDKEKETATA